MKDLLKRLKKFNLCDWIFLLIAVGSISFLALVYFTSKSDDSSSSSSVSAYNLSVVDYTTYETESSTDPSWKQLQDEIRAESESRVQRDQERREEKSESFRKDINSGPISTYFGNHAEPKDSDLDLDDLPELFDPDDIPMQFTDRSTCFKQIGYDSEYRILKVTFRDSGRSYLYLDVSPREWEAFASSDSLGTYYNTEIKGYYDCIRLEH